MAVVTKKEEKKEIAKEYIPPDGGWAWMIVVGCIISAVTNIPIVQNFALIYKERLLDLKLTSTDITTIVSMNAAVGQILGVFQGPLLKRFGFRKVAVFGVAAFTLGTFLTGISQSFLHFALTHGIITSIGFTYSLTSFSFALNSYFRVKRSRASGLTMGFAGLGPVIMPQFVTFSLSKYGVMGTGFLLAALNANGFVGACLLRPLKWYRKEKVPEEEKLSDGMEEDFSDPLPHVDTESMFGVEPGNSYHLARRRSSSGSSHNRVRSISGGDGSEGSPHSHRLHPRRPSLSYGSSLKVLNEEEHLLQPQASNNTIFQSQDDVTRAMKSTLDLMERTPPRMASVETLEPGSHNSLFTDSKGVVPPRIREKRKAAPSYKVNDEDDVDDVESDHCQDLVLPCEEKQKSVFNRAGKFISKQFDLDLLHDPVYIVITLGLSVAVIGELIFSILTPFILHEVGLDLQESAYFMSVTAITDIISRFVSPYIGECIRFNSRVMYILALFLLLISRASLLFVSGTVGLIFVAVIVGFAKGVRIVFLAQVIPDYVHPDKLGSAMSIQNLINGILIIIAGPLSGLIVEINNSYLNIIYVSNVLTGMTILLWAGELFVSRLKKRNKKTVP